MKLKFPSSSELFKKIGKKHLLIGALIGVLLLVITVPTEEKNKSAKEKTQEQTNSNLSDTRASNEIYRKNLEQQLELVLSAMEGVGTAEVMITMKDEGEYVVEKDWTNTKEAISEQDSSGTTRGSNTQNSTEETVYVEQDSSHRYPFVSKEVKPRIEGVLVVAKGAENPVVVKNISDAILALFPVAVHKIKVVKMNE